MRDGDLQLTVVQVADVAHPAGLEAARQACATALVASSHGEEGEESDQGGDSAAAPAEQALADADLVLDGIAGLGSRPGLRPRDGGPDTLDGPARPTSSPLDSRARGPERRDHPRQSGLRGRDGDLHRAQAGARWPARPSCADGRRHRPSWTPTSSRGRREFDDAPPADARAGGRQVHPGRAGRGRPRPGTHTGAAVLSTLSAVESGVGMVRYVGPDHAADRGRKPVPEAVYGTGRVQAHVVGPGLDVDDDSEPGRAQVQAARDALDSAEPCVVDAGALSLLDGPRSQGPRPHPAHAARRRARDLRWLGSTVR